MKKYLMFGLAALAFASCNKTEFEPYTPEQIVEAKYNQAFIQTFGQPAANHTWGFGTTRAAVNVNGNEWQSMPVVTVEEKNLVFKHVNKDKSEVVGAGDTYPYNLKNYWVSQVWTGTGSYTSLDGGDPIVGSAHMDNLQIAETTSATITDGALSTTGWYHVNNFNRGDNTDWSGNTLVCESGTCDFAYNCSEDAKYHNRWIAVPGSAIDESLKDYYYICFDFEASKSTTYTNAWFKIPGNNPGEWVEKECTIPGSWTNIDDAAGQKVTIQVWSNDANGFVDVEYTVGQEGTTGWRLGNVVGGNQIIEGDNNYTDWIIRLVPAQPKVTYDGRIMGEDLSASEGSDFDFNDVVFDFKITSTGAKILLQAAGGTLPLKIGGTAESNEDGFEVHELFKVNTNIMVNTATDASPKIVTRDPVPFELEGTFKADGSDIPVFVKKDGKWMPLTANVGKPASKFSCKTTTAWVDEYINIELAYPKFSDWVKDPSVDWENNVVEKYVNLYINRPNDNKAVATE